MTLSSERTLARLKAKHEKRKAQAAVANIASAAAAAQRRLAVPEQSAVIQVQKFNFVPNRVMVRKGASVTWSVVRFMPIDDAPHRIVVLGAGVPTNNQSPELRIGESFTMTFDKPGQYEFFSSNYTFMNGFVEVVDSVAPESDDASQQQLEQLVQELEAEARHPPRKKKGGKRNSRKKRASETSETSKRRVERSVQLENKSEDDEEEEDSTEGVDSFHQGALADLAVFRDDLGEFSLPVTLPGAREACSGEAAAAAADLERQLKKIDDKTCELEAIAEQVGVGEPEGLALRGGEHCITVTAYKFTPKLLDVVVGDLVRWQVSSDCDCAFSLAADDGSWESGPLGPGETFERTFDEAGAASYACSIYTWMRGQVRVRGRDSSGVKEGGVPEAGAQAPALLPARGNPEEERAADATAAAAALEAALAADAAEAAERAAVAAESGWEEAPRRRGRKAKQHRNKDEPAPAPAAKPHKQRRRKEAAAEPKPRSRKTDSGSGGFDWEGTQHFLRSRWLAAVAASSASSS